MDLKLMDRSITSQAAGHILNLLEAGDFADHLKDIRTLYPRYEGLPYDLTAEYVDNGDNGHTVNCALVHAEEDMTAKFIEGVVNTIRERSSMDVAIQTTEGVAGVKLVFTRR